MGKYDGMFKGMFDDLRKKMEEVNKLNRISKEIGELTKDLETNDLMTVVMYVLKDRELDMVSTLVKMTYTAVKANEVMAMDDALMDAIKERTENIVKESTDKHE